eukprot:scaffold2859_cov349-Pavlova_lutheri.AAC.3
MDTGCDADNLSTCQEFHLPPEPEFRKYPFDGGLLRGLFRDEELGFECEHERLQSFDLSFEIGHLISEESDFFFPSLLFGSKPG